MMGAFQPTASLFASTSGQGQGLGQSQSQSQAASAPRAPQSTSNALSSLLAQANSLSNSQGHAGGAPSSSAFGQAGNAQATSSASEFAMDTDLPQIRFGIDEIERMSESVGGKRTRGLGSRGEGHALLSNLGINTSHLSHTIAHLPSHSNNGGLEPSTSTAPRRRRRTAASRTAETEGSASGSLYPPTGEGDITSWGRNFHEMVILSGIEAQRQKTVKAFEEQFQQRMLSMWEAEKARVLQDELGVTDDVDSARFAGQASVLGQSSLGKSSLGASTRKFPMAGSMSGKSTEGRDGGLVMHTKMVRYERVVGELNYRRLQKQPMELCQALEETVKGDQKYPLLPTAYRILAHIVQEPSLRDSSSDLAHSEPVQERQYASAYLGEHRSSHASFLRGRLVLGGRRFLERDFENHVDEMIAKHPRDAALGGVPGIRNKIRAFVDVVMLNKENIDTYKPESVDGKHLWAQAYYLVRCGYPEDALALISEHESSLKKDDWSFPGAFKTSLSSPDRRLPRQQRDQLYNDFNSAVRTNPSVDQYKYALYKLVGRFELNRKSAKVAATTEDWIWLQLCLVREAQGNGGAIDPPAEQYDLRDLQALVSKYGSDKFDANGTRPFAWFNLLLFSAQFEKAVAYLWSKTALRTDAVHFAVALSYYGLLRVSPREDADLLTTDADDRSYLNFPRLIKQYIAPFFKLEPQTALQYAYLVALSGDAAQSVADGEAQKRFCLELVRDIVLASRSWSKLLGSVRADGSKETGIIERDLALLKLSDASEYLRAVVLSAADQSLADGALIDSIELYHLAGSYAKVVESVNRALGRSISQAGSQPLRSEAQKVGLSGAFGAGTADGGEQDLYALARRVRDVYERDAAKREGVPQGAWETLGLLLQLKEAMAQFAADRPDLALETFKATNLLPLDNDPAAISRQANRFLSLLDQPIIQNLDDIIVTTMKCLHRLSQQLKQSPYGDQGRQQKLQVLKSQAMALIQFASGMRLRLGPDVYRQLSSMSAFF